MKHLKLFEDFTGKRRGEEFEVKRTADGLEILNMIIGRAEGKMFPTYDVQAFDYIEYAVRSKKPLIFGRDEYKKDLEELEGVCKNLKVEKVVLKNQNYRPERILITGSAEDLDKAYELMEKILKQK